MKIIFLYLQDNFKALLSQTETLRTQYKARLEEEVEKITNPAPVSWYRPASNSSSMLSCEAAEFVPSWASTNTGVSYFSQYVDTNYYNENHYNLYNYDTSAGLTYYDENYYYQTDQLKTSEVECVNESKSEIWNNIVDILKS